MLNKDVFKNGMEKLLVVFPQWGIKNDNPQSMKIWYEQFEKVKDSDFNDMVNAYIKHEKFNPTVAGLYSYRISERPELIVIPDDEREAFIKANYGG